MTNDIQLPPNSTGTKVQTRSRDGAARQVVAIGEPLHPQPQRNPTGQILYVEDFRHPRHSVWNDGRGFTRIDNDITFAGRPSLRLDTAGQSAGVQTNPNRTAITTGVIAKRRIHDGFRMRLGISFWFRLTGLNLTSNMLFSHSIYNRDGAQAKHFRVWLDPNGNNQPMHGRILDGAATNTLSGTVPSGTAVYADAVTSVSQNGGGTHTYDPPTGRMDLAGGWHYCKMVVDFATLRYVSLQLDAEIVDISAYQADVTDSTGFAGMHNSFEFCGMTTTRRFLNIANVVATVEN